MLFDDILASLEAFAREQTLRKLRERGGAMMKAELRREIDRMFRTAWPGDQASLDEARAHGESWGANRISWAWARLTREGVIYPCADTKEIRLRRRAKKSGVV